MKINYKLMREAFISMAHNGIDPTDFVNWYFDEGISYNQTKMLQENCKLWLHDYLESSERKSLISRFGGSIGGKTGGSLQGIQSWLGKKGAGKEISSNEFKNYAFKAQRAINIFRKRILDSNILKRAITNDFEKLLSDLDQFFLDIIYPKTE